MLAVEMLDGSPHGATVHFAHTDDPLVFYFETNKAYRKSEPLLGKKITRASMVIGTDEKNMQTFQSDGIVRLLKNEERAMFDFVYLEKFSEKKQKTRDAAFVPFVFVPTWWRFTDWTTPQGKMILTSDDDYAI